MKTILRIGVLVSRCLPAVALPIALSVAPSLARAADRLPPNAPPPPITPPSAVVQESGADKAVLVTVTPVVPPNTTPDTAALKVQPPEPKRPPAAVFENWLSFRYSWFDLKGTDQNGSYETYSATFRYDSTTVFPMHGASAHGALEGAIGGGAGRVEGQIGGGLDMGFRAWPSGPQGIIGRLGVGGQYLANARLTYGHFEAPEAIVGYQYLDPRFFLELTGRAGLSLVGVFDAGLTGHNSTPVTLGWGADFIVQARPVRLDTHLFAVQGGNDTPGATIWNLGGALCVEPVNPILLCAEAAAYWGDQLFAGGVVSEANVARFGFTVGFGQLETKMMPKGKHDKKGHKKGEKPSEGECADCAD